MTCPGMITPTVDGVILNQLAMKTIPIPIIEMCTGSSDQDNFSLEVVLSDDSRTWQVDN